MQIQKKLQTVFRTQVKTVKDTMYVCYEHKNGMQNGKKGWWTVGTNGGMSDNAKFGTAHNKYHPVTKIKLH